MKNESHPDDGSTESRRRVDEARSQASTNGKRVAVIFGADWCPDYQALEAALESPYVAPFVDPAYELVRLDVGQRDRHLALMGEYDMDVIPKGVARHRGINPPGTRRPGCRAQRYSSSGSALGFQFKGQRFGSLGNALGYQVQVNNLHHELAIKARGGLGRCGQLRRGLGRLRLGRERTGGPRSALYNSRDLLGWF